MKGWHVEFTEKALWSTQICTRFTKSLLMVFRVSQFVFVCSDSNILTTLSLHQIRDFAEANCEEIFFVWQQNLGQTKRKILNWGEEKVQSISPSCKATKFLVLSLFESSLLSILGLGKDIDLITATPNLYFWYATNNLADHVIPENCSHCSK